MEFIMFSPINQKKKRDEADGVAIASDGSISKKLCQLLHLTP
jgi:hypothetical protein